MLLLATADVPDSSLAALASDLEELGGIETEEHRAFFKSAEPPSWVVLFEHVPTWVILLGPAAAVFLNELLKEAAKDTWRNKKAIARALTKPLARPLRVACEAIGRFGRSATPRTSVHVGVPRPEDFFGTRLTLARADAHSTAVELALFIHHCEGIQRLLDDLEHGDEGVVGQITLTLLPDGGMQAEWLARDFRPRAHTWPSPIA
jgi:hypothetical protein